MGKLSHRKDAVFYIIRMNGAAAFAIGKSQSGSFVLPCIRQNDPVDRFKFWQFQGGR